MSAQLSVDPVDGLVTTLNEEAILDDDGPEEKVGLCPRPFRLAATFEYAVADSVEGARPVEVRPTRNVDCVAGVEVVVVRNPLGVCRDSAHRRTSGCRHGGRSAIRRRRAPERRGDDHADYGQR